MAGGSKERKKREEGNEREERKKNVMVLGTVLATNLRVLDNDKILRRVKAPRRLPRCQGASICLSKAARLQYINRPGPGV